MRPMQRVIRGNHGNEIYVVYPYTSVAHLGYLEVELTQQ